MSKAADGDPKLLKAQYNSFLLTEDSWFVQEFLIQKPYEAWMSATMLPLERILYQSCTCWLLYIWKLSVKGSIRESFITPNAYKAHYINLDAMVKSIKYRGVRIMLKKN